ncbi:MAG: sugar-binding protein [Gemmataceae bacterium]
MFRLTCAVLLALGPGCLLALGDDDKPPDTVRVAFVANNIASFWTVAEAGTRKAEKELKNVKVEFRRPRDPTPDDQRIIIDDLLDLRVKAIALCAIDPEKQTEYIDRIAARVPIITQDNDAPGSKRLCFIGTDNYAAGKDAGKLVKKTLPDGGTIAIFVGRSDVLNARQRRQGLLDELAGVKDARGPQYGKYKLLDTFTDNVDEQKCAELASDAMTKLAGENNVCLIGLWAYNPPALLKAVRDAKKTGQIKIVGFDEEEGTLIGVREGHIEGTVVQQPFELGYQSVKLMAELARGNRSGLPKDGVLYIPHLVLTKDNVKEFHEKLDKLLGK